MGGEEERARKREVGRVPHRSRSVPACVPTMPVDGGAATWPLRASQAARAPPASTWSVARAQARQTDGHGRCAGRRMRCSPPPLRLTGHPLAVPLRVPPAPGAAAAGRPGGWGHADTPTLRPGPYPFFQFGRWLRGRGGTAAAAEIMMPAASDLIRSDRGCVSCGSPGPAEPRRLCRHGPSRRHRATDWQRT